MELEGVAKAGSGSEHSASFGLFDHTMWHVGEEWVDCTPGYWKEIFARAETGPRDRAFVEKLVRGLSGRLEEGAVLTVDEYRRLKNLGSVARTPPKGQAS